MRHVVILALLVGVAVGDPKAPDDRPQHFGHVKHGEHGIKIDSTTCRDCHATDAKGTIMVPAAKGHSPCQNGVCHAANGDKKDFTHASWFVAVGATTKAKDRPLYDKATRFCTGCHGGTEPPSPATKPGLVALQAFESEREWHVEMPGAVDHFFHTQQKINVGGKERQVQCTDCHQAGGKTDLSPAHAQCARCHGDPAREITRMSECASCHRDGGRDVTYVTESRVHTDVRQCNSEGHRQWAKRLGKDLDKVSCFMHERMGHQLYEEGATDRAHAKDRKYTTRRVECSVCHTPVTALKLDLKAMHEQPIVPRDGQEAGHAPCHSCHYHQQDLDGGSGPDCQRCHAKHV